MPIENTAMNWDDVLENDGQELVILPEGDYTFTVTGFERSTFPGGPKLPPCPKASLTLTIDNDQGPALARVTLLLCRQLEWKTSGFFISIGQKKRGEKSRMDWTRVMGARGKAHIRPREYTTKDGEIRHVNDVVRFIDYDPTDHFSPVEDPEVPW